MSGTNPANPAISGAAWVQPQPQAVLGLSSSVVYGSAFQSSIPLSFQAASGGLFKVIVDPVGFIRAFQPEALPSSPLAEFFGSGEYGNMQLTLGTSANIVMGQAYTVNVGPEPINLWGKNNTGFQTVAQVLGFIMLVTTVAFQIVYGVLKHDDDRSLLVVSYQLATQLLLGALMIAVNMQHQDFGTVIEDLLYGLFDIGTWRSSVAASETSALVLLAATAAAPATIILPPILASKGEEHLDRVLDQPGGTGKDGSYMSVPKTGIGS